ncbi:MAG: phage holin family protein [Sarcina sp.]
MEKIKIGIAGIGTTFTYLFGGWDTALVVLCVFMCLDYATGVLRGIIAQKVSSQVGFRGIAKKAVIFIILIVAVLLDRLINVDQFIFRTLVCYFYIANEGISILENCGAIGLPIPAKILQVLEQLKQGEKKEKLKGGQINE